MHRVYSDDANNNNDHDDDGDDCYENDVRDDNDASSMCVVVVKNCLAFTVYPHVSIDVVVVVVVIVFHRVLIFSQIEFGELLLYYTVSV